MARKIYEIAAEIQKDIGPKGSWGYMASACAKPYLEAMHNLATLDDKYGLDSARSIVRYFLANASTWRGETARRLKKELNNMLDGKV